MIENPFTDSDHARRFKLALASTPLKADEFENGLQLRPTDLPDFEKQIEARGLGQCETAKMVLQYLNAQTYHVIGFKVR
jgi:hypothetical protein